MKLDDKKRKKILETFRKTGIIRETARVCKVSRNTVRNVLGLKKSKPKKSKIPSVRPGKLDPYKAKIHYLVTEVDLSAVRILDEIKQIGYQGGYSILKDYVRKIRPKRSRGATSPIDHAPGHEAQMDWSKHTVRICGRKVVVHTGSIVLCYSRWMYLNFFLDETSESVIKLHEEFFKKLGYVPATITYDNMTTVGRHIGPGKIWINPIFKKFAEKYGFEIIILPPGHKDRHGIVERPFHYIENNCLKGREFNDFEHLIGHGQWWLDEKANPRIHGTLRERPVDRLKREIPFLKLLPEKKYEQYKEIKNRTIYRDFCVRYNTNRYSVHPDLVGRKADLRLFQDFLEIWVGGKLATRHCYGSGKHQRIVLPEHESAYRGSSFQSELLKKAFLRLGDCAQTYFEGLKRERGKAAGFHLQRILKMADRHGSDVVSGALAHAQRHGVFSADAVIRVINGKTIKRKGRVVIENVPENIRQWLRSCAVEEQKLSSYDELIKKKDE